MSKPARPPKKTKNKESKEVRVELCGLRNAKLTNVVMLNMDQLITASTCRLDAGASLSAPSQPSRPPRWARLSCEQRFSRWWEAVIEHEADIIDSFCRAWGVSWWTLQSCDWDLSNPQVGERMGGAANRWHVHTRRYEYACKFRLHNFTTCTRSRT